MGKQFQENQTEGITIIGQIPGRAKAEDGVTVGTNQSLNKKGMLKWEKISAYKPVFPDSAMTVWATMGDGPGVFFPQFGQFVNLT